MKKQGRFVLAALAILIMTSCGSGGGSGGGSSSNTYFPSTVGKWVKFGTDSNAPTYTITQGSDSTVVITESSYLQFDLDTTYTLNGNAVYSSSTLDAKGSAYESTDTFSPPCVVLPSNLSPGSSASSVSNVFVTSGGNTSSSGTVSTTVTVNGIESVTVPSGTYQALKVTRTVYNSKTGFSNNSTLWYAPNIGLIQETDSGSVSGTMSASAVGS